MNFVLGGKVIFFFLMPSHAFLSQIHPRVSFMRTFIANIVKGRIVLSPLDKVDRTILPLLDGMDKEVVSL
jgi:hypothetical protein